MKGQAKDFQQGGAKAVVLILLALLAVAGAAGSGWFFYYRKAVEFDALKTDPGKLQQISAEQVAVIKDKVGKLMELPADEEPTIATVSDVEKLRQEQEFFKNAQNGDKVLIYVKARKAIMWRPETNRIIEVAPININSDGAVAVKESIVIRNGTARAESTRIFETMVARPDLKLETVGIEKAAKTNYPESILVDLKGSKAARAEGLAQALGVKTGQLPEGEPKPENVDFLLLVGAKGIGGIELPTPTPPPAGGSIPEVTPVP